MSRRKLDLHRAGVPENAYEELHRLCLQYPHALRRQPRGEAEMRLIEQAAVAADPEAYQELLRAVTNDLTWAMCAYPRGINQFGERRRRFYVLLAQKRGIIR